MGLPGLTSGARPEVVKGWQSLIGCSEFETTLKLKNGKVSFPSSTPVNRNDGGSVSPGPSPASSGCGGGTNRDIVCKLLH